MEVAIETARREVHREQPVVGGGVDEYLLARGTLKAQHHGMVVVGLLGEELQQTAAFHTIAVVLLGHARLAPHEASEHEAVERSVVRHDIFRVDTDGKYGIRH